MQQQILVIDDSKTIHPLVKVILSDEPVEVHSAMDAKYGMVLAASTRPDLILLDVDMPGMDGFEACKQLKADPATANVPIIFLTSHATVAEKVRGLGLGAIDYVTKPFNRAELMARVRASLRTNQSIRALEEKATIDALTGLGNRAMFDQRLEAEVCLHVRTKHSLSCILMDVDRFKRINDTFGHPFGDKVLKRIAEIITDLCRTEDVACRYGGEEFAILAPNTNALAASIFAERLRVQISRVKFVPDPSPS
ncbi:MAG TPA: diguanylate cyclase, partial [Humisphaera sp.]|nr:diguanylate cyclase [Humisphaera sp.]